MAEEIMDMIDKMADDFKWTLNKLIEIINDYDIPEPDIEDKTEDLYRQYFDDE